MDVVNAAIGLFGIVMGARALSKGTSRLAEAMGPPRKVPRGMRQVVENGVPTTHVPRSATLQEATMSSRGARQATVSGPMRLTLRSVNTLGDRLSSIIKGVDEAKTDPTIVAYARRVTSVKRPDGRWVADEKDTVAEIRLIHAAIRRDVRYTSDPRGVDLYANPKKTLEMRAGDCDEESALACAALMAIGIPCKLKVIQTKGSSSPDHIYALAASDKSGPVRKWIPVDPTVNQPAGWEAPPSMVRRAWVFETE